ncbi:hypothetical protein ES705_42890 [subsurface metagenome]
MKVVFPSALGKIILFGEHAMNRGKAAVAAAVDRRVYCRIELNARKGYLLIPGEKREEDTYPSLGQFKQEIDRLREDKDYDGIREHARDFFAPIRYVLAHLYKHRPFGGIKIEWHSQLPMGAGLGSGAATYTSLVFAFFTANGIPVDPKEIADTAYQGDIIAHGGIASSLDSSTSSFGEIIRYTVEGGAQPLKKNPDLALVLVDTLIRSDTADMNTIVRKWLSDSPSRGYIFENVGFIVDQAIHALEGRRYGDIGNLMDLYQLLQGKIGTGCLECRQSIDLARRAGALGAKITGSGGGGMVIALCPPGNENTIARSIIEAGGTAVPSWAGAPGGQLEDEVVWNGLSTTDLLDPFTTESFDGTKPNN